MKNADTRVTADHLMAYVDGQLPAPQRAAVEVYLDAHAEAREQVDMYRRQNAALHGAFDSVLDERIPDRMLLPASPRRPAWISAAVAASLVVGALGGWIARAYLNPAQPAQSALVQQAAVAHSVYTPEVRHPVEVGANEEAHLVQWLSKRLGRAVRAPNLKDQGYNLVGGRLLPAIAAVDTASGNRAVPAAQFMYEDTSGQRLTLYVRARLGAAGETAFRYAKEGPVDVFYWIEGEAGYALSGTLGREKMLALARVVYQELTTR